MARRITIPFRDMALRIIGPRGNYLAARIQRLDMPVNFPSTDIDELGNRYHAGQTTDIPEITATFQAMDVSIKLLSALTGTDPNNYPAGGVDISEIKEVDLVGVVRSHTVADYVKSIHLRKCMVTGFTLTYTVDGEATEEYTISGTEKRWFKHDIIVDVFDNVTTSPATLSDNTIMELKNGNYCLSVILDGEYLTEIAHDTPPATEEYSVNSAGTQLSFADTITDYMVVVYHANPVGNNWVPVLDNSMPAAVRGKNIPVRMATNNIPRVQSVTVRGTFPNEVIKEMGNTNIVGTVVQVPSVTCDVSVLDTDDELIALFTTGELNPSGIKEFRDCEFTVSGIDLDIRIHDPASGCGNVGPVLKTVYIPEIVVTAEGHSTNVGGNATQTFTCKSADGRCIVYSGLRI